NNNTVKRPPKMLKFPFRDGRLHSGVDDLEEPPEGPGDEPPPPPDDQHTAQPGGDPEAPAPPLSPDFRQARLRRVTQGPSGFDGGTRIVNSPASRPANTPAKTWSPITATHERSRPSTLSPLIHPRGGGWHAPAMNGTRTTRANRPMRAAFPFDSRD